MYCSDGFCDLVGLHRAEIMQVSPVFDQGPQNISKSKWATWLWLAEVSEELNSLPQKPVACTFLWGPATDASHKYYIWFHKKHHKNAFLEEVNKILFRKEIFAALEGETEAKLSACFYKADDRPFWCLLDIIPIKNELSEVAHHMEAVDKQSQVMNQVVLFLVSTKDITTSYTASRGPSIYSMESDPLQMEGTKVRLF